MAPKKPTNPLVAVLQAIQAITTGHKNHEQRIKELEAKIDQRVKTLEATNKGRL